MRGSEAKIQDPLSPLSLGAAAAAAIALAGCASFSGLEPRAKALPADSLKADASLAGAPVAADAWPAEDWWKRLGDPQLDTLMQEALTASPNMRIVRARVDRAVAAAQSAGAALWPNAALNADTTRQRFSATGIFPPPIGGSWYTITNLGVSFAYELDFWGRNRATYDAAIGRQKASLADAFAARLVLSSAIASAYVQLARSFDQLDLARLTLEEREAVQKLTVQRVKAGLDSRLELKQVETSIPAARARVAQIGEEIALTRNQLAALAGQGPDRGLALERPRLAPQPVVLPSALPADLLGRRPDIVASRWRVEAASRDIASTKAAFYPNVNLAALLGVQTVTWGKLLSSDSAVPSFGAALHLPLFDAGRLRGELAGRDADYDLALEQYNQALVDALREVVDQLASLRATQTQRAEVEAALGSAEEAYAIATTRYRAGLGTLLQVITAEVQVLEQRSTRADLQAREVTVSIQLVRALGGGFNE
jgi:NodT family efflux transporter outer membrane factor (OMF) lipoprotein